MNTPLLIVGTGAMACLFAARLSAVGLPTGIPAGRPAAMLGTWLEGLQALQGRGVTLVEVDGSQRTFSVRASDDPADFAPARFALVLVKSWQTRRAALQLKQCLAQDGVALTLQNGIGNRESLVEILGESRVALGVTTMGANLQGAGLVQAAGEGSITIGPHPHLDPLAKMLRAAGFTVDDALDPDILLWGKLVINAAINPLTALLRVTNGELLNRPSARSLMAALAGEAAAVAAALGYQLPYNDPIATVEEVASRTTANRSSMLQDVQRGTPTEIDAICGAVVRAGKGTGVPTPVNDLVWQLVNALSPPKTISICKDHPSQDTSMKTVSAISELRALRARLPEPVGLVPTMGYLHEGHLSLVRAAQVECASVVVSIFINPTQFGPSEDLDSYPRDLDRDLALLDIEGVNLVWIPTQENMYPPGDQTWVTVDELTKPLEGAMRTGHFRGVTTVVAKLFNAVHPDKAYFGQKDAQQAIVIRQMARDLHFPLQVVVCPIVREPDGLAMSSRNAYLNTGERQAATALSRALNAARTAYASNERDAGHLRQIMTDVITAEPLARLEYVSCADPQTLEEIEGTIPGPALLSMAVFFGKTRLIDNTLLEG